jgi:CRP-like cAMP-binding protein
MLNEKIVAPLLRVPAFAGLKPLQLTEIARNVRKMKFLRGDVITRAGQVGDGAYLIVSGPSERVSGYGVGASSEPVEPGSMIGELAMLIEHPYGSTVVARDWVFCLKIMRTALHAQMLEDPSLAEHFEHHVAAGLHRMLAELRRIDGMIAASAPPQVPTAELAAASLS